MRASRVSMWKQITTEADNETHDVGYVGVLGVGALTMGLAVPVILALGALSVLRDPAQAATVIQSVGIAVGACAGGFATALGALGIYRFGDSKSQPEPVPAEVPIDEAPKAKKGILS